MSETEKDIEEVLGLGRDASARRTRNRILIGLAVLAAAAGAGLLWLSGETGDATAYRTAAVTRADLVVTVTATGTVEPTNKVEISSELSGIIRSVAVGHNDTVHEGQVLARLDTDKLEAQLAHSRALVAARRAQVAVAEATLVETRAALERTRRLIDRSVVSEQALESAEAAFRRAEAALASTRADVAVAEADLTLDETNLAKACICSPIDGVVLARNVEPGQIVAATFQAPVLFTLAEDLRRMQLEVDVDEADVGQVAEGDPATFTVDAFQDRSFAARITEVRFAPETVEGVVSYKAILSVDNDDLLLRPGMTATATITVETVGDALTIPNAALRYAPRAEPPDEGGGGGLLSRILPRPPFRPPVSDNLPDRGQTRTVFVLRDGRPVGIEVEVGASDGSRTVIAPGVLAEGDTVIVDEQIGG